MLILDENQSLSIKQTWDWQSALFLYGGLPGKLNYPSASWWGWNQNQEQIVTWPADLWTSASLSDALVSRGDRLSGLVKKSSNLGAQGDLHICVAELINPPGSYTPLPGLNVLTT